ncbi:hypothetical protein BJV77DRAFT_940980, partial [Russula vinacea]
TGVSTDISTSFVKPTGKPGDELNLTGTLTAIEPCSFYFIQGKSLAYIQVDFTNPREPVGRLRE